MVLREEETRLDVRDLWLIKNVKRKVKLRITGINIFTKDSVQFLVLSAESSDILQIRTNLGLPKKHSKMKIHISLFERIC